ncbi:hypothetical protein ACVW0Y_000282 [Pseudomonas sp. TE3786]
MRLTDASVAIRPRSNWEAIDLGVLLARQHVGLLFSSWLLISVPVFLLISAALWQYPSIAFFLFWLLKPAFDRLPLHILSQALFGNTPTLKQAVKAWPRLLKPQLLQSLTWRRLSLTRSFDLPVLQLEGLAGAARSKRLGVLGQHSTAGATWLTVLGAHLEGALWLGLTTLFYLLLPQQMKTDWDWQNLIRPGAAEWLWLEHLNNSLYLLILAVWEPVYVACGFTLYLNRRTTLEGWDIELTFRRLRQRLTGIAYVLMLGFAVLLLQTPSSAWAEEAAVSSCPIPYDDPLGPDKDRLFNQPLTSKAAQSSISSILDQPPFENRETVTLWHFGDEQKDPAKKPQKSGSTGLLDGFEQLLKAWQAVKWLASGVEILLWGTLITLVVLLVWRYREWLSTFTTRLSRPKRQAREVPSMLFGLDVAPQSLPEDVAGAVERLWSEQPREALGLLYRALLSRLLHDFQLPLKGSHTEGEVQQLVNNLEHSDLSRFTQVLTRHWQNLAYGHQLPPDNLKRGLCEGWRRLFQPGAPV